MYLYYEEVRLRKLISFILRGRVWLLSLEKYLNFFTPLRKTQAKYLRLKKLLTYAMLVHADNQNELLVHYKLAMRDAVVDVKPPFKF